MFGVANFLDVITNAAFVLAGVAGLAIVPLGWMALWSVRRRRQGDRGELPPSE